MLPGFASSSPSSSQVRRGRQQHMGDRVLRDEEASLTTQIAALQTGLSSSPLHAKPKLK